MRTRLLVPLFVDLVRFIEWFSFRRLTPWSSATTLGLIWSTEVFFFSKTRSYITERGDWR